MIWVLNFGYVFREGRIYLFFWELYIDVIFMLILKMDIECCLDVFYSCGELFWKFFLSDEVLLVKY